MTSKQAQSKREAISDLNEDAVFADNHDNALIGFVEHFEYGPVAAYDKDIVLKNLQRDGMSEAEAEEYFYYNILGAYVGPGTPAFLTFLKKWTKRS